MMYGYHWWGMGGGWFIGLIVLALIIWLVVRLVNHTNSHHTEKTALDILKERYIKGEIGKEEFDQKKKDLV